MRMRKKPNLQPRMARCAQRLIPDPENHRGHWRELLPGCRELRLELGCGKGRFTAETAAREPDVLFIAVERVPDAMIIAVERAAAMGLDNVFFVDGDAAALEKYFESGEVDRIYINFCDPWPSNRHAKRRLTHRDFLLRYRTVLADGGEIHFKTDNRDLFEWSLFQFPKAGYALSEVTRDLHAGGIRGVMTDYEEKFHNLGTPINRCVGTKEAMAQVPVLEGLGRRLEGWEVRAVGEEDLEVVLSLLESNGEYGALWAERPSLDTLRRDLSALPPRCVPEQKHYVALWREGKVRAVLDWVEDYPRAHTLWIGLLMVEGSAHRQGVGRMVAEALSAAAGEAGMDKLRLGCLKENEQGRAFWKALGFREVREGKTLDGGNAVWIMERPAQEQPEE